MKRPIAIAVLPISLLVAACLVQEQPDEEDYDQVALALNVTLEQECTVDRNVVGQCGRDESGALLPECDKDWEAACDDENGGIGPATHGAFLCEDDSALVRPCDKDFVDACLEVGFFVCTKACDSGCCEGHCLFAN